MTDPRRALPSVSSLLEREDLRALVGPHPRSLVVDAVRKAIDDARRTAESADTVDWQAAVQQTLNSANRRLLRPVYNATGVILHTNLGRAPLAEPAVNAIHDIALGYTNLEYDLETGSRGSRYVHCVELLRELTGAEDAIVVNNCAAALVLSLSALARGKQVLVSRGELVEIGGSFRVPDIMERSGADLCEVGTTNRTHLEDYSRAITSRTGAIAKVHRSNFSMSGFVADADVNELAALAVQHHLPLIHDLGSGLIVDLSGYGLTGEPAAQTALRAGATIVLMSGDKLLGGPQAGIVLGARGAIAQLRQDPFARAMRVDKMTIAALAATLDLYRDTDAALREIPVLRMITTPADMIRQRCESARQRLLRHRIGAEVVASVAGVGAGAFPAHGIPSFALSLDGAERTETTLRSWETPVIGRIRDGRVLLDLRSIPERDDGPFIDAVAAALQ
ncbi:MAG TPA: L-seryl-tRNA(Sec) selenium transferase [Gemmatimonadaceae bacterium]|nr:L-seryl-tRNA(Sec) selenium transferase [Gemmatimonadaceae bacterium]